MQLKIWLDDIRKEPEGWRRTLTVEETVGVLESCLRDGVCVECLSLDNDLGEGLKEGRHVLDWIEMQAYSNPCYVPPRSILVHSSNSAARLWMDGALKSIKRLSANRV